MTQHKREKEKLYTTYVKRQLFGDNKKAVIAITLYNTSTCYFILVYMSQGTAGHTLSIVLINIYSRY